MGAQEVHGGIKGGRGIVLPKSFHGRLEILRRAVQQVVQKGGAEGIIHHAMELAAQEIPPAAGVGNFIAGILPDLTQDQGVGVRFFHSGPELFNELAGKLVRHVQTPAGGPGPKPALHHGVFPLDNIIHVIRAILPDVGQRVDAPPGVVGVGPPAELEPVVVGTVLTLGCSQGGVEAVGIEVDALRSGMVEHAVQQDADAPFLCLGAEVPEILFSAQHRVDSGIVRRVVAVVGGGFKNRAEV